MFTIQNVQSPAGDFVQMLNEDFKIVVYSDGLCKAYDVKNDYRFLDYADSLYDLLLKIN